MTLQELMDLVKENWRFDQDNYPGIPSAEAEVQRKLFCVEHVFKHLGKSVGRWWAISEAFDHAPCTRFPDDEARAFAAKMLINTLRLATVLGMDEHSLAELVKSFMKKP